MAIELDDILKILQEVRSKVGAQVVPASPSLNAGAPVPNPPGWQTQAPFRGDPGITTTPPGAADAGGAAADDPTGAVSPVAPGMQFEAPMKGDQPGFSPRTYAYGHMATLTPEQASAFQMMMLIQGHNGDTVGRGHVVPVGHPTPHTGREQVAGA